jgi:hypothetical protein
MPESHLDVVKALFESLGAVENFAVIPNRGFYVEFAKPEPAASAVRALHGEVLGGNVIAVQHTSEAARATLLNLGLPVTGVEGDGAASTGDLRKDLMSDLLNMQLPLTHCLDLFRVLGGQGGILLWQAAPAPPSGRLHVCRASGRPLHFHAPHGLTGRTAQAQHEHGPWPHSCLVPWRQRGQLRGLPHSLRTPRRLQGRHTAGGTGA